MGDWDFPQDPLAALRDGDHAPFEALVHRHTRTFFAFFRRLGAEVERAEDLTQDVFVKLYEKRERYRPEERLAAFCFRVARNVWIDERRRTAVRPPSLALLRGPGDPSAASEEEAHEAHTLRAHERDPFDLASLHEEDERVYAALETLAEPHRVVFELGALEELPYAEISELLGIPVGTVKSRMFHAVRKLRQALGDAQ